MKASLLRRCRAGLVGVAVSLGTTAAGARDTAGPEPQRPPDAKTKASAPAAPVNPAARSATAAASASASSASHAAAPRAGEGAASLKEMGATAEAERAKQLYALGAEAFAAQRNADAIRYFRRAAELVPSPKLTYNIGLAYEEMGDAGRALSEYRTYLEQEAEREPAHREEVLARIVHLERRLADTGVQQLRVKSEPAGATVRVAGRALGVTPWTGELTPGEHVVELDLPGHAPERTLVTLAADHSAELELSLAPSRDVARSRSAWSNVSPLTWTFLGVGVAALAGGVAFEISRSSSSDAAARADDGTAAAEARGAADAKQMASLLFLGFGAGFSIGGSVLLALELSEPKEAPSQAAFGATCARGFCGVAARGHF